MSRADEAARNLTAAIRSTGYRMADLFSGDAATVIPPEADNRHRGGNPCPPANERHAVLVDDRRTDRQAIADTIERELGYTNGWAIPPDDYTAHCLAAADMILARLRPPGSPGDGPATAPHVRGSDTSKAAARAVAPKLAGKRLAVLREIMETATLVQRAHKVAYGFTDNDLIRYAVDALRWSPNTPRARRVELERGGWLEDSGERRNGSTVWRPTYKAWAWWYEQQNGGAS